MDVPATPLGSLTIEEYLKLEEGATVRHEYVGGEIYAMVGASRRYNEIVSNISGILWNAARGSPCRVYSSDFKLRVSGDVFYYPDVMVECNVEEGPPLLEEKPCLVV